jgi:LURP-one-related
VLIYAAEGIEAANDLRASRRDHEPPSDADIERGLRERAVTDPRAAETAETNALRRAQTLGRYRLRSGQNSEREKAMGLLRRRDREGTRYTMREQMFATGDDYWIETESGERALKVNGKALRIRDTLVLESPSGEELFTIQEKKLRDKMEIERDGRTVATIKKALVSPLRDRFSIEVEDGPDLEAKGEHR